jgi:hypothetical protein
VTDSNVFQLSQPGMLSDPLTEVLRSGARALRLLVDATQRRHRYLLIALTGIALVFWALVGPAVRIRFPPAGSQVRTCLSREFAFLRREARRFFCAAAA